MKQATLLARAVDRLAQAKGGIPGEDYKFSLLQVEPRVWGITLWNEDLLGPQPTKVQIIAETANDPLLVKTYSKLKVVRALREEGLESVLDQILTSNPTAAKDFTYAQVLMSNDPMLAAMVPVFATAANKPQSWVLELLATCLA